MDYLEYFGFTSEPFSPAPLPRLYYASQQHTNALNRLLHTAHAMRGLAVLIGDIGRGKTTLARRMLDALPETEYEAAMLVIIHTGVTANWLLKRIALQLGVPDPADEKLEILAQLYQRLVAIHESGRKAVVLIDEAQMLQTKDIMEEFRGLLNLEVPGHKLISFVFFGLPPLERYLALDPPLSQRVAMRYELLPLSEEDTHKYVQHRLRLAGGDEGFFDAASHREIHTCSHGVPRVVNTLCDNILMELFFTQERTVTPEFIAQVASNLSLLRGSEDASPAQYPMPVYEAPAIEGGLGADAIVTLQRDLEPAVPPGLESPDDIAARIACESSAEPLPEEPTPVPQPLQHRPQPSLDIADPLAFLHITPPKQPAPLPMASATLDEAGIHVHVQTFGGENEMFEDQENGSVCNTRTPTVDVPMPEGMSTNMPKDEELSLPVEIEVEVDAEVEVNVMTPLPKVSLATPNTATQFTTSSGQVIDFEEIDDLLADLE